MWEKENVREGRERDNVDKIDRKKEREGEQERGRERKRKINVKVGERW